MSDIYTFSNFNFKNVIPHVNHMDDGEHKVIHFFQLPRPVAFSEILKGSRIATIIHKKGIYVFIYNSESIIVYNCEKNNFKPTYIGEVKLAHEDSLDLRRRIFFKISPLVPGMINVYSSGVRIKHGKEADTRWINKRFTLSVDTVNESMSVSIVSTKGKLNSYEKLYPENLGSIDSFDIRIPSSKLSLFSSGKYRIKSIPEFRHLSAEYCDNEFNIPFSILGAYSCMFGYSNFIYGIKRQDGKYYFTGINLQDVESLSNTYDVYCAGPNNQFIINKGHVDYESETKEHEAIIRYDNRESKSLLTQLRKDLQRNGDIPYSVVDQSTLDIEAHLSDTKKINPIFFGSNGPEYGSCNEVKDVAYETFMSQFGFYTSPLDKDSIMSQMKHQEENVVLLYGAAMVMHGVKPSTSDIDCQVVCSWDPCTYNNVVPNDFDNSDNIIQEPFDLAKVNIQTSRFVEIDGIKCQTLGSIIVGKLKMRRRKDFVDILRIFKFLAKQSFQKLLRLF